MRAAILAVLTATVLVAVTPASPAPSKRCPVTRPNTGSLYSNGRLSSPTYYPKIIVSTRHLEPNGSIGEKFPWRAYGAVGDGQLRITGRRLDRKAPPLRARINPGWPVIEEPRLRAFWAVGMLFPTVGCWEITGRVGTAKLTFVTLVVDPLGLTKHSG